MLANRANQRHSRGLCEEIYRSFTNFSLSRYGELCFNVRPQRANTESLRRVADMPSVDTERESVEAWPRRAIVWLAISYGCAWAILTHWPKMQLPHTSTIRLDKIAHFGGYMVLAFLVSMLISICWRDGAKLTRWDALGVFSVIAVCGLIDEWTQPYFGRSFEWADYLADLPGALIGMAIAVAVMSYRHAQQRLTAGA